jgi:multiple sugar transport system substrate-binding protein
LPTQLRGITWNHPRGVLPFVESSALYAETKQVAVNWEAFEWDEFRERQFRELGEASLYYDLVQYDHPWVGIYSSKKWVEPLDDYLSKEDKRYLETEIPKIVVDSYIWEEKLWALPVDMGAHVSLWRKDVLDSLGLTVPQSWEEVLETGRGLTNSGYPRPYAFANKTYQGFLLFLELLAELGGVEEGFGSAFKSDKVGRALSLMSELATLSHPDSIRWNPWDVVQAVAGQNRLVAAPSVFGYVDAVVNYKYSSNVKTGLVPRLDETGLRSSILGGVGMGINHATSKKSESFEYCWFNVEPETCEMILEHNGQPAVKVSSPSERIEDYMSALRGSVEGAFIRPRFSGWPNVEKEMGLLVSDFLQGKKASEVVNEMRKIALEEAAGRW